MIFSILQHKDERTNLNIDNFEALTNEIAELKNSGILKGTIANSDKPNYQQ